MSEFTKDPYLQWQKSTYDYLLTSLIYVIVFDTYFVTIFITAGLVEERVEGCHKAQQGSGSKGYHLHARNVLQHSAPQRRGVQSLNPPTESEKQVEELQEKQRSMELSTSYMEYEIVHSTSPGHVITTEHILTSKWAMTLLSWYVASVASLALVVFWEQFIVEQITASIYESKNADCYILDTDGRYTLVNISDPLLANGEPIAVDICHALGLDFPKAIAEVAGILFLSSNDIPHVVSGGRHRDPPPPPHVLRRIGSDGVRHYRASPVFIRCTLPVAG